MTDFSLLSAVKNHLQTTIKGQTVHLNADADLTSPCCLLELEEVWTNMPLSSKGVKTRIKFRATCFHDDTGIKSSLAQANMINQHLDGHVVHLKDGSRAAIRLLGNVVDVSKAGQKKTVAHFYETIIRG